MRQSPGARNSTALRNRFQSPYEDAHSIPVAFANARSRCGGPYSWSMTTSGSSPATASTAGPTPARNDRTLYATTSRSFSGSSGLTSANQSSDGSMT